MSEEQIIHGVKQGDRDAQTALFTQYRSHWYMICLRYNKDANDALDALQNGLIKIYTKMHMFDLSKGSFKAWSSQVIVNENLMFLRKRTQSFKVEDISEINQIEQEGETPIDMLSAEELTKLVQLLPDGYRVVFNMYVMEGYSHAEIAEELGISSGTSKSQLFKARKLLQQRLEVLI